VPTAAFLAVDRGRPLLSGPADLFPRRRVMMVCGVFRVGRVAATSARISMMGWLAVLVLRPADRQRVEPSAMDHSAAVGAGGRRRRVPADGGRGFRAGPASCHQSPAFGVAQSGLCAVQGLGILVGGALAQAIGAPLAVGLADLVGVTAATVLAMSWTHLRGRLIIAQRSEAEAHSGGGLTCRTQRLIP
jgi:hypothetical protein